MRESRFRSVASGRLAWSAGLSYSWKFLTFDIRYWDPDLSDEGCVVRSGFADGCDARVVGTISIDRHLLVGAERNG